MSIVGNPLLMGSGSKSSIVVFAPTGSTVTLTLPNSTVITGTEVSGTWTFQNLIALGTYTVTATRGGITKTKTVLIDVVGTYSVQIYISRLPEGYQGLSYIESTGTQYIDTGVKLTNATSVKFRTKIAPTTANTFYFGCYQVTAPKRFYAPFFNGTSLLSWMLDNSNVLVSDVVLNTFYEIEDSRTNISYTNTQNIYMFASNDASSGPYNLASCKLAYYELYIGGVIVLNLIPCYRKSDGEVGMYDTVSQTFFTNQGTGSFRMGAIVDNEFVSEYQQVEYLQSSETQYIDTGIVPTFPIRTDLVLTDLVGLNAGRYLAMYDSGTSFFRWAFLYYSGGIYKCDFGNSPTSFNPSGISIVANEFHQFTIEITPLSQIFSIDGVVKGSANYSYSNEATRPLYMFAGNYTGTVSAKSRIKIKECKIIQNSTLVRNFIPCYRKSDSVAGMYDMVNRVFYTNAGTGTFTVGADIDI